ncbi:MAG: hypothetical protein QOF86_1145 [Baekduia sp.]|jgi:uncharacterized protein with FMN-binding domain|nr:hypothetical protein [Baekduia sp.]
MRRAPIILSTTVAGVAALLSFKARAPALPTPTPAAASAPSPGTSSGSAAPSSSSSSSSSSSKTAGASSSATKTATGDAVGTPYGNAQVRVTISGGKITKIEALQLQGNDRKSVEISSFAEPLLRQSALTKQSASIDAVSGATFTSASYEASLQSALDKAGFKAANGARGSSQIPQVQDHRGPGGGVPPQFNGN